MVNMHHITKIKLTETQEETLAQQMCDFVGRVLGGNGSTEEVQILPDIINQLLGMDFYMISNGSLTRCCTGSSHYAPPLGGRG